MFGYKGKAVLGDKGRLVIPQEIRRQLELKQGDLLGIELQDGIIQIVILDQEGEK